MRSNSILVDLEFTQTNTNTKGSILVGEVLARDISHTKQSEHEAVQPDEWVEE